MPKREIVSSYLRHVILIFNFLLEHGMADGRQTDRNLQNFIKFKAS